MSYCPKCGNKVDDTMTFCPRCGASLKMEPAAAPKPAPPPTYYYRSEKSEKQEKREPEKGEKGEKYEKGEYGFFGWLIGGVIIILIGLLAYAEAVGLISGSMDSALVLLMIGVAVILAAVWISMTARRRHPAPST